MPSRPAALRRAGAAAVAAALVGAGLPTGGTAAAQAASVPGAQGEEAWQITPLPQSTLVFARDGSLIGEIGREWRQSVALRSLPKYLPAAFIAVEDKRFWQHDGVDLVGVAAAIKGKLLGSNRGGASTITQQLVGNLHPRLIDRRDMSLSRKLREQSAAREMERHYGKEQILEAYLNAISFGRGVYGVEAAARHYFGKPAARLTLAEAATLAAMPKAPTTYDPSRNPDKARQRRNVVLQLMAEQGLVSQGQADAAKAQPVETAPAFGMPGAAPYAADLARRQAERAGIPVSEGGYRLYTTVDASLQRAANEAVAAVTAELEARPGWKYPTRAAKAPGATTLQAAVVALDPATGDIRALVGGRDFRDAPFNRAVDGQRQPGSAFKPIVYGAALAQGLAPNAVVEDTALALPQDDGGTYAPRNADGEFLGTIPLREALAKSRNPVAVQLFLRAGADSVAALAGRLGVSSPVAPYPSSALGASVLSPLELVQAYASIAALGTHVEPRLVQRVDDPRGRPVWAPSRAAPTAALDPRVAFVLRDLLREPVERGTAAGVRRWMPARVPVAGKTGTTDDNSDVWFVGMTPDVVAGVWLGLDRPRPLGSGVQGGTLAAPVFGRMLGAWYAGRGTQGWPLSDRVIPAELDRATGLAADDATPPARRYVEYFVPGTEPPSARAAYWRRFVWAPALDLPGALPPPGIGPAFLPPPYGVAPYTVPKPTPSDPSPGPMAPRPARGQALTG